MKKIIVWLKNVVIFSKQLLENYYREIILKYEN